MSGGGAGLAFRVLGPIEMPGADAASARRLQPQHRALLTLLLLHANRLVTVEQVYDGLWGAKPPATASAQVHNLVSAIRAALRDAGDVASLERQRPGYLLHVAADRLDLAVFRRLVTESCAASTARARAGLLREAVELWRGRALSGIDAPYVEAARVELDEERTAALEALFAAELELGHHTEAIAALTAEVARRPLRERLVGMLMLGLYRAGRTADALRAYDRTRRALAEETGLDPGVDLQRLHRAILRADPHLRAMPPSPPWVAQLPADLSSFTGRAEELHHLLSLAGDGSGSTVVISAIDGMAGIGKTALAVHAAHRLAVRYPDGQVFIDLHGHTRGVAPVEPADALDRMLRSLGVPGAQIPRHLDDRAALWRSLLAGRRMLVLLDNAATDAQVQPLLPGSAGCLVLVTSRRRLAGVDDARPLSLDLLPPEDARTLFARVAGDSQPPDAVAEIVELCCRLPLALRIAAARLRARPSWTAEDLARRLRDRRQRLAELEEGRRSVAAAVDLSYRHLTTDQQRLYRLLGLHPGADVDAYAAAALADVSLNGARRLLDDLIGGHLLTEPTPGRYRFHDLIRAHAAGTAQEEPEPARHAALTRLLDSYTRTAEIAMRLAYPHEARHAARLVRSAAPVPRVVDGVQAANWLDTELANLLAVASLATQHGWSAHAVKLAEALELHMRIRCHLAHARTLHDCALIAARASGDRSGEVTALNALAHVHRAEGPKARAIDYYGEALQLALDTGNRAGELTALSGLGHVYRLQARYRPATGYFSRAVDLARRIGDRPGEASALLGVGHIHHAQRRHAPAAGYFAQALDLARTIGDRPGAIAALHGLGLARLRQNRFREAAEHFEQARDLAIATGHRIGELDALRGLGQVHLAQGSHERAIDCFEQSLDLSTVLGSDNNRFEAMHGLGQTLRAAGNPDGAVGHHRTALDLAVALDQPGDQARAHDALARTNHALGDVDRARHHWREALDLLTRLDLASIGEVDADDVRTSLAALDNPERT